jgi:endonuclease/exonuclease/phosphatase family metal-dependent hydrolase
MRLVPVSVRTIPGFAVIIAMFVLGGLVLTGLFLAPHSKSPPAPTEIPWAVPDRPLRFVSYNILHNERGVEQIITEIKKLDPDFVCLQEIESKDVAPMVEALSMQRFYHDRSYQRSENLAGRHASWGNCILSKFPLYEMGPIPNPGGGIFGVWAVAVVDGKKFLIANVHLSATWNANPSHLKKSGENRWNELTSLFNAWHDRGSPPILITGDFNQIPLGNNYELMTRQWTDGLKTLGETGATFDGSLLLQTRIDYFLVSHHFSPAKGGVVRTKASDHRPIWIETRTNAEGAKVEGREPG